MTTVKKVFKYATGDVIPEGAVYLTTNFQDGGMLGMFAWHYFLVEVEEN